MATPHGVRTGQLSLPASLEPAATGVSLATAFNVRSTLGSYAWTGSEVPGTYTWILAAIERGSLADGRYDPGDVVAVGSAAVSYSP
jgi:hypothetical protein